MSRRWSALAVLTPLLLLVALGPAGSQPPARGHAAQARNMELVGHDDLQGRSAYQPTIHRQRGRWIAYVGHHGGRARNPLTGADEDHGTSIVDVTDPGRPRYLAHIPGAPGRAEGAQMARVCEGSQLPRGGRDRTYLLRTTNNVEVDERGFVYLVDRANTGLHVVRLTGEAQAIADPR
jgi:hypothetical protein